MYNRFSNLVQSLTGPSLSLYRTACGFTLRPVVTECFSTVKFLSYHAVGSSLQNQLLVPVP